jgi:diacylglycerol O-acyltransferase / wax synthase
VVLTVVSGALAQWLHSRGVRTEGLEMRALVPVSVRTKEHKNTLGNKITVMRGPLPVYIEDPVARLRFVRAAMDGLKESKQAEGAATLAAVNNLAPPTVLAQASRLNFSTRLFNLIVTNIPGPQLPLYVLGRKLEDVFPVAFLPEDHALAIAIMSYDGGLDFGLLGDYDALPDIDMIADGIAASLAELLDVARGDAPRQRRTTKPAAAKTAGQESGSPSNGGPAPIVPPDHARPKRGPAADMRAKRQRGSRPARKRASDS